MCINGGRQQLLWAQAAVPSAQPSRPQSSVDPRRYQQEQQERALYQQQCHRQQQHQQHPLESNMQVGLKDEDEVDANAGLRHYRHYHDENGNVQEYDDNEYNDQHSEPEFPDVEDH
jgi:hypothetical protein